MRSRPVLRKQGEQTPEKLNRKPEREGNPGPKPKPSQMQSVLTAHYFRHNFATLMYDAGVDLLTAIKIVGHNDQATLLKIYTDLSKEKESTSLAWLDHMFK
jgi:integrase